MNLYGGAAVVVLVYMIIFFCLSLIKKNMSIADIAWGFGFVLISWYSFLMSTGQWFHILLTAMVSVWGTRLTFSLGKRNIWKPEDWRYAQWRNDWGRWVVLRSFFQVFMLQGLLMFLISLPILWMQSQSTLMSEALLLFGVVIWIFGFIFEVTADAQLRSFVKTKKRGEIMMAGLWKYSRHPNYFGEAVLWWCVFVMSLGVQMNWWLIVSPVLITFLLRFVSGVPMLERKWKGNKTFENYAKVTNPMLPWFGP